MTFRKELKDLLGGWSSPEAKVPVFICAKILAGVVLFGGVLGIADIDPPDLIWAKTFAGVVELESEVGSGGTGGGIEAPVPKFMPPKLGLNPVGSVQSLSTTINQIWVYGESILVGICPNPLLNEFEGPLKPMPVGLDNTGWGENPVGWSANPVGWGANPVGWDARKGWWKEGFANGDAMLPGLVGTKALNPVEVGTNGCNRPWFAGTGAKWPRGPFWGWGLCESKPTFWSWPMGVGDEPIPIPVW
jgi:hypothetical protein